MEENLADLEVVTTGGNSENVKVDALGKRVERVEELIPTVKNETFAIQLWPKLRSLYLSGRHPNDK